MIANIKLIFLILCSILLIACVHSQPSTETIDTSLTIATPESQNMRILPLQRAARNVNQLDMSSMTSHLQQLKKYNRIDSMLFARNGKLVFEKYFNGASKTKPHHMASLGKSVLSAMVGVAIDKGYFESEQDSLYRFIRYPSYQHWDENKKSINLEHLLTMTAGWNCGSIANYKEHCGYTMLEQPDPYKWVLDLPMKAIPGTKFNYNDAVPKFISASLMIAGKQTVAQLFNESLMQPLKIENNIFLTQKLNSRDMLKLGLLYLNKGKWGERQLISESWVEKSTSTQVVFGSDSHAKGYGYFWWQRDFEVAGRIFESFYAAGNGGQYIIVIPELDLVSVFTGSNYNNLKGMRQVFEIMESYVLPSINNIETQGIG